MQWCFILPIFIELNLVKKQFAEKSLSQRFLQLFTDSFERVYRLTIYGMNQEFDKLETNGV